MGPAKDLKALTLRVGTQQGCPASRLSPQLGSIPPFCITTPTSGHACLLTLFCSPRSSCPRYLKIAQPHCFSGWGSLTREASVLQLCPSVLNWEVTLFYPLESIWTQPARGHWQLPARMPGKRSSVSWGQTWAPSCLRGSTLDQSCLKPQM